MNDNVIIRTLRDGDKKQVKALWKICFDDADEFTDWFFKERWCADYGVCAVVNGNIVSAIQGWYYTLNIRGKKISSCIMSGVSTQPEYRKRGYMSMALAMFMEKARDRGECAVFCKPAKHTAYFKYHHYTSSEIARVILSVDRSRAKNIVANIVDANSIAPDSLMESYKACIEKHSNSVCRSKSDMALKLRDYASCDGNVIYISQSSKIIAYCVSTASADGIIVEEFCAPDIETRDELFNAIVSFHGCKECVIKMPCSIVRVPTDGFEFERVPNGVMGAANIPFLLRELAGFDDVTVRVIDHVLPSNDGAFYFNGKRCKKTCDIIIDSGHLLQLLNGFYSIDELIEYGFCSVMNFNSVRTLRERLPKLKCHTIEEY